MSTRSNRANDGRAFQEIIKSTARAYERIGVMKLEKCDPPVTVVGTGRFRRVVFMPNPFLDFVGCLASGRALIIEAKSTSEHLLPINRDSGLTPHQYQNLLSWHQRSAIACVLWEYRNHGVVLLKSPEIEARVIAGFKSLAFEDHTHRLVPQGRGFILLDFIKLL